MTAPRIRRPYCLRCYRAAEAPRSGSRWVCDHCGRVNLKQDQLRHWNQEPWLMDLELIAKGLVALFLALVTYLLMFGPQIQFGTGQGVAIGFPILAGAVLWWTVEKLTRYHPYFRAGLFWGLLGIVCALPFVSVAVWPAGDPALGPRGLALGAGALLVGFGLGVIRSGAALVRWRDRYVAERQRRHAESDSARAAAPRAGADPARSPRSGS